MRVKKAAVLVAGSWGTALAAVLADNDIDVTMWTRNAEQAEEMNREHRNSRYLQDYKLSPRIRATTSMSKAMNGAEAVIVAATSASMREVAAQMAQHMNNSAQLIHATKGFEVATLKRMSTVLAEALPSYPPERIVVLSGPSLAEEVLRRCPTTVAVAAQQAEAAQAAQDLFMTRYFRVYTNRDLIGIEVGGALKNIIALGAGLSDGLGFGDNAKAALITRGLAEISRLGVRMGAHVSTFAGLAGVGDLIVTCTSTQSRNWTAGHLLGQGISVDEVVAKVGMVVEGIKTTQAAYSLSRRLNVTMPITDALYAVLFEGKEPRMAVEELMLRDRTDEVGKFVPGMEQ